MAATTITDAPPDVRGQVADDAEALRLMDYPDSTEEIPTLDISDYLAGGPVGAA